MKTSGATKNNFILLIQGILQNQKIMIDLVKVAKIRTVYEADNSGEANVCHCYFWERI